MHNRCESNIKVRLGDIAGNWSEFYEKGDNLNSFLKKIEIKESVISGINLIYLTTSIIFLILYTFLGVLLTIIFHNKFYGFLFSYAKKINYYPSYVYEFLNFCYKRPSNFLGKFELILISIIFSILSIPLIIPLLITSKYIRIYDWVSLYESLLKKGYNTEISTIKVKKLKHNKYYCLDGNHRHIILLLIHGVKKKIDVILVDS